MLETVSAGFVAEYWPESARPSLKVLHLVFQREQYGGIETYIDTIQRHSRHSHSVRSVFDFGLGSYPTEPFGFRDSSRRAIEELKLENRSHDYFGKTMRKALDFLSTVTDLEAGTD